MCKLLSLEDHGITDESNIEVRLSSGLLGGADEASDTTKTFDTVASADPSKDQSAGKSYTIFDFVKQQELFSTLG